MWGLSRIGYFFMSDLIPWYNKTSENTTIAIPPTISKTFAIPGVMIADVGTFINANPDKIEAK